MLPHQIADELNALGHDAISPLSLGEPTLADVELIAIATSQERVIVTENWRDFASVTRCAVLFVRKSWWPAAGLAQRLTAALIRWSDSNPERGPWAHWLEAEYR
jgi:hypothetical protein